MRLRTEMRVGLGAIMTLQIVTSLGAIGLLSRVSPGVDRILTENVPSIQASEAMLSALALDGPDTSEQFEAALADARAHVTLPEEAPLIDRIADRWPSAVEGSPIARRAVIADIEDLARANRSSMKEADRAARFLGTAGAWAMVVLGALGFGLGLLVQRRLRERIELPILRLDDTLAAARRGDEQRRCHQDAAPWELTRSSDNANWLLSQVFERPQVSDPPAPDDRAMALHLLDLFEAPLIVVGTDGRVQAMNLSAMRAGWDDDPGIARRLADAVAASALLPKGWSATPIPNSSLVLCRRDPSCDPPPPLDDPPSGDDPQEDPNDDPEA